MVGGWALSGAGLVGLAVAQALAGLAQCALEGDLDARIVARAGAERSTSALALASSSRALGGALAVWLLPYVVAGVALPKACLVSAGLLAIGALVTFALRAEPHSPAGRPRPRVPAVRLPLPLETAAPSREATIQPLVRR
jgi:hypothetical protein